MIITLESGEDLRGDLIQSAIVRHDLIPIPVTLELNLKDFYHILDRASL